MTRLVYTQGTVATPEETVLPGVGFTEAKSALSELMTDVVHGHRPELIERHRGKEVAVLVAREDLLAMLCDFRFRPRVALGGEEATAVLEDFGLIGAGADFEAAMASLVRELRRYAHEFLVERPSFYMQTDRARHAPWLLRFALTPPDEHLDLLYEDSRAADSEESLTGDPTAAA